MVKKKALALVLGLAMLTSCSKIPDKNEEEQTSQTTEEIVIADLVPEISLHGCYNNYDSTGTVEYG